MTLKNLLKILFVEDLPSDAELAILELRRGGLKFEDKRVDARDEFIKALKEFDPDIVISDYMMPSYTGLMALGDAREFNPGLPFILYTGSMNEETAVECLKAGADDYIIKEHLTRLPYAVKEALEQSMKEKEKKAAELLLKENEEKLQSIFSAAPVGIGLVVNSIILETNDTFCTMTGFSRKELIGKNFIMVFASGEEYDDAKIEEYRQIAEKGTGSLETRFNCKDGRILNILLNSSPLDKDDLKKGVTITLMDMTVRRRSEEALRRTLMQQERVNLLQQSLLTSESITRKLKIITESVINIFDADFCRIWLIQPGDLCEQGCIHALKLEGPHICKYRDLCLHLKSSSGRYNHTDGEVHGRVPFGCYKIGQIASSENHKFITNDAQNDPHIHNPEWTRELGLISFAGYQIRAPGSPALGVLALFARHEILPSEDIILDGISSTIGLIVQQTRAEEALRESEEKYRLLIDTANEAITVAQDGLFKFVNNSMIELLEVSSEQELIGKPFPEFIHPDDRKMVVENYRRRIANEASQQRYSFRVVTRNGIVKWVELNAVLIEWQGKPATLNFLSDITERKRTEKILQESEEKYRRIFENVLDLYYETSIDGTIIEISPSIEQLSKGQYHRDDLLGKSMYNFYADAGERAALLTQIKESGSVSDFEITLKNRDGSLVPCSVSSKIFFDTQGHPEKIIGSMRDIKDRKLTEDKLRSSEERLKILFDYAPDAYYLNDLKGNLIDGNLACEELLGHHKNDMIGKSFLKLNLLSLKQLPKAAKLLIDNALGQRTGPDEFILNRKDGTKVPVEIITHPVKIKNQTLVLGIARDITERRKADDSLRQSELKFKQLSENSGEWIWEIDKNGLYTYSSPVVKEMLGYEPEEIINKKHFYDFFNPALSEQLKQAAFDVFTRKESFKNFPNSNLHKEGREVILYTSGIPMFDNEGNYIGYRGVDRDITESKNAEEALRKSEEKFRSIMENSADAIFITDQQGKYQYVNKAATDMLGFTAEEIQNKTIADLAPPDKTDEYFEIFKRVMSEGKIFTEIELLRKDGIFIPTDLNSVLLPGGLLYGSCRDITERKQIQMELYKYREHLEELVNERTEQLSKAKKEAEDANKAKSEFLANMSHEIRTPMNAVLGYSELLSSTPVDQTQKNYINSIKSSGRSLLKLINDILDLSKIEAGKLDLEYDYVDTYSFFTEFERIFSHKVGEKGLKFILDITSGTPAGIYIDEARVRQIVFNLIGNAIKFTSEGKIVIKVFTENPQIVNYSNEKSEELIDLILEVQDTGIGISKELQEAIFEPFVQKRDNEHHGGTGLGLTISRRLTSLMHGTINLQSKPGKGSTFTVRIPEIAYLRDFSKTTVDIQIDPSEIAFEKSSIIIADDVEHNRSYLRDALKHTNLNVIEAEDGIAAYKLAMEIVPDLIIADVLMPKMDGFQLLDKIKTDKKLKHIPVIAYSASVLKDQKDRIHNSEFAGLLVKPVKVAELYLELMRFLPYKSTREAEPDKSLPKVDLIGEITNRPGLIHSLETGFYSTWKTFAVRQPIGEIRDFGKNLIQLGMDHNSSIITGYGKELISAADSFNIEAILKLLGKYMGVIESLKDSSKILNND